MPNLVAFPVTSQWMDHTGSTEALKVTCRAIIVPAYGLREGASERYPAG